MSTLIQPLSNISTYLHDTVRTPGTYVHPNDLTEHDVIEIINTSNTVQTFNFYADVSAIIRNNFKLRVYLKIDNSTYQLHNTYTFSATDNVAQFEEAHTSFSIKVTAQSSTAEGATRNIPYIYYLEPN